MLQGVSIAALTGAGRSLQNRFDAADQRDDRSYARGTLRRENDHCIALMQIGQCGRGRVAEQTLNIRRAAGTPVRACSTWSHPTGR